MSFWPFGQSEHSNINRLLEEYFQVLHSVEKHNENGAETQATREEEGGTPHDPGPAQEALEKCLDGIPSIQMLNNSFIDGILEESELLNELTRQNNTLLDFICFGYFYTADGVKVQNIEYLIDQLIECVGHIDANEFDAATSGSGRSSRGSLHEFDDDDCISGSASPDNSPRPQQTYLNKATIISEIFALDIWLISESLVKNSSYLNKIWSIIYHPNFPSEKSPLIPIFLKINQNLLSTRQDQYLNFIRSKPTLVDDLLKHIQISVLMDLLLKIISTDKQESPTGIIELVHEQRLTRKLLCYLDNDKHEPDIQACAADVLKAIIAISANAPLDDMSIGPNSLTRDLASEECIDHLLDAIINKRSNALINAVSIVIELIRKNNSDYDQVNLLSTTLSSHPPSMRDPIYLGVMLRKFTEKLTYVFQILVDIERNNSAKVLENQLGEKYKPLGFERFKVVELIAELLHCSNMGLLNSKKAERIVSERNKAREMVAKSLQDALADLDVQDNDNTHSAESRSDAYDEDVDESFEIPYVNPKQNSKLRENPTIGDRFKISLYDNQILPRIIYLFLKYPWNNFWHNVVFDIIQQLFNGRMDFSYNSFLVYSLFNNGSASEFMPRDSRVDICDFQITRDLILKGYKDSYAFYEKHNTALGFMGHLVLIAEEIVKFSKVYKVELISPKIQAAFQDEEWIFYSEDVLNDTRIMYSKILGGNDYLEEENGYEANGDNFNNDSNRNENPELGGSLINVGNLDQDQSANPSNFPTTSDLHNKLRKKLIDRSREDVDRRNEENGVIILGMAPEDN
ncbi:SAPS family protein [Lachancea thermotolerans CBS 6340]|uniref:KLTH0G01144p n=1 Tax=Lachancea thermotolerans (strain ATCC 56472 / CBS 6340 / NRRL Y-8284) TaxID=559295 RepID=C5DLJ2_LACTC|nr:KLTH0G01144p [Lachancea thermotolerans CBS 6340]CAR24653.1 KLTH0G01144p [Lachancea thermotolerans CBS 6340]